MLGATGYRRAARGESLTDTGAVLIDPALLEHHRRLITHAARISISTHEPGKVEQKHRALARQIHTRIDD